MPQTSDTDTGQAFDLVVFGATSFVGKILVHYLHAQYPQSELRWAVAGRSESKLRALQKSLPSGEALPSILIADATNESSLQSLCNKTRCIVSTVGPFSRYGEVLVKACVESGTDYCDSTGEVHWVLQMISRYQAQAAESGARLVHCCGFDSIPSDLGVKFTQRIAHKRYGHPCDEIAMRVMRMKGRFSGGTIASLFAAVEDIHSQPALRKAVGSPYCLCPSDHPYTSKQLRHDGAGYDEVAKRWIAPFIMEGVNTRIVHRSNALQNHAYGEGFLYDEALVTGLGRKGRKRATRTSFGLHMLMFAAVFPPLRWLLEKFWLPAPGEGPSEREQEEGEYTLRFYGKVRGRGTLVCEVKGDRDPGYGSTAKMLGEAAVMLAKDSFSKEGSHNILPGGFWTPATAFGDELFTRLEDNAGLNFTDISDEDID